MTSVSHLLPRVTMPVLGQAAQPVARIMLATDLGPEAEGAAREAMRLAHDHGAALLVLTVLDPNPLRLPGGRFIRRIDQAREELERGAQCLVETAREMGIAATFLVWEGDPAEMILAASEAEQADLVVLGSRGRTGVKRLLLGSVSARVARDAHCPVVVVREEAA